MLVVEKELLMRGCLLLDGRGCCVDIISGVLWDRTCLIHTAFEVVGWTVWNDGAGRQASRVRGCTGMRWQAYDISGGDVLRWLLDSANACAALHELRGWLWLRLLVDLLLLL